MDAPLSPPPRRHGWFTARQGARIVHARHWPPRFDVSATARLPHANLHRLARAVRQDLWRKLQGLRGFSPVVEIERQGDDLSIRAGGRLHDRQFPPDVEERIRDLLHSADARARWLSWAQDDRTRT
nr:hypothetical protein [Roseivivax isoporae]